MLLAQTQKKVTFPISYDCHRTVSYTLGIRACLFTTTGGVCPKTAGKTSINLPRYISVCSFVSLADKRSILQGSFVRTRHNLCQITTLCEHNAAGFGGSRKSAGLLGSDRLVGRILSAFNVFSSFGRTDYCELAICQGDCVFALTTIAVRVGITRNPF